MDLIGKETVKKFRLEQNHSRIAVQHVIKKKLCRFSVQYSQFVRLKL